MTVLFHARRDPWPSIDAQVAERPWVPEPGVDGPGSPGPQGNREIAWLRPTERPVGPSVAWSALGNLATESEKLKEWLWMRSGSKYRDERATRLISTFPARHADMMRKLALSPPHWGRRWSDGRRAYWSAWADGDAPFHYAYPMWNLQLMMPGDSRLCAETANRIAHAVSYGLDWTTGELLSEKCNDWTGDYMPPGRNGYSHQWPEVVMAMAHLAEWDRDDACVQAARIITERFLRKSPPAQGKWGPRHVGWYLRGLRSIAHFGDDPRAAGHAEQIARQMIADMIAISGGKGWINDGPAPHRREVWQEWLVLSEMLEWGTRWVDWSIVEDVRPIAEWHLAHTTSPSGEVAYKILDAFEAEGPQKAEWFENPTLTTYAIPALRALSHVHGEPFTAAWRKAWDVVLDHHAAVDFQVDAPSRGLGWIKQCRRAPYGIRPDFEPEGV